MIIFLLCKAQNPRIMNYFRTFATKHKWNRIVEVVNFISTSSLRQQYTAITIHHIKKQVSFVAYLFKKYRCSTLPFLLPSAFWPSRSAMCIVRLSYRAAVHTAHAWWSGTHSASPGAYQTPYRSCCCPPLCCA